MNVASHNLSCNNLVMNKQNFWYRKKSKLLSLHISTAMLLAAKHLFRKGNQSLTLTDFWFKRSADFSNCYKLYAFQFSKIRLKAPSAAILISI